MLVTLIVATTSIPLLIVAYASVDVPMTMSTFPVDEYSGALKRAWVLEITKNDVLMVPYHTFRYLLGWKFVPVSVSMI